MAVMDRDKYDIVPIGITHDGRWLTSGDPMAALTAGEPAAAAGRTAGSRAAASWCRARPAAVFPPWT